MSDQPEHYVAIGCRHDARELAALARETLPTFPALHAEEGWRTFYRYGGGLHPRDNYLLTVRECGEGGQLAAFVWVDAALSQDQQIDEPWWCINALTVAPPYRGRGLGRALVQRVGQQARDVGVVLVYGLSVQAAVPFWDAVGMTVAADGEELVSDRPVRRRGVDVTGRARLEPEPDHRFFVGYLPTPATETAAVLVPATVAEAG